MTKKRNSKTTFIASIVSMLLCLTMLFGTTLAWFTDTVTNTNNQIVIGTLGVELSMYNDETGAYENIEDNIFGEEDGLWEPGMTRLVHLQVANVAELALDYKLLFEVVATKNGSELTDIGSVMEYAIIPDTDVTAYSALNIADWIGFYSKAEAYGTFDVGATTLVSDKAVLAGENDNFVLAVHMSENAGNEYQNLDITFDVKVNAKQSAVEKDSFGDQYDTKAEYGTGEPVITYKNLCADGDFENPALRGMNFSSSTTPWRSSFNGKQGTTSVVSGGYYSDYCLATTFDYEKKGYVIDGRQRVTGMTGGTPYTVTAMVKLGENTTITENYRPDFRLQFKDAKGQDLPNKSGDFTFSFAEYTLSNTEWTKVTFTGVIPADAVAAEYWLRYLGNELNSTIYWDDVQFLVEE